MIKSLSKESSVNSQAERKTSRYGFLISNAEDLLVSGLITTIRDIPLNLFTTVPEVTLKDNVTKP